MTFIRTIIVALLFLVNFGVFAQSRLGFTFKEIINQFPNEVTKYDANIGMIFVDLSDCEVIHYFDNNLCIMSAIYPKTQQGTMFFKEKYDRMYYKMNDYTWKGFLNGAEVTISAARAGDNVSYTWR